MVLKSGRKNSFLPKNWASVCTNSGPICTVCVPFSLYAIFFSSSSNCLVQNARKWLQKENDPVRCVSVSELVNRKFQLEGFLKP